MKRDQLKAQQAICKANYAANPVAAFQTLRAHGRVDFENLAVQLEQPAFWNPAGLHPSGGGDGTFACPVEIMLAGLVSCAGVTLAAVATSMQLPIAAARVVAEGDIDFRGTLAVDKSAPMGLVQVRLRWELETTAEPSKIDKLLELTQRYCVVHRTLESPPPITVDYRVVAPVA